MLDAASRDPLRHDVAMNDLLLVAGRLWDGTGAGARRDMALVIRDGRVERVTPAAEVRSTGADRAFTPERPP